MSNLFNVIKYRFLSEGKCQSHLGENSSLKDELQIVSKTLANVMPTKSEFNSKFNVIIITLNLQTRTECD
jgi:hypothetical protein